MPVNGSTTRPTLSALRRARAFGFALLLAAAAVAPASAELAISQLVVELGPDSRTVDIEVFNDSSERAFVTVEPREILKPGTGEANDFQSPDPERLGLLVSPRRMILEPNQRKRLRIAAIGSVSAMERVYRVTVKPVVGEVTGNDSGLKLLVGYDLLVLARPVVAGPQIVASRDGLTLTLTNRGNASAELVDGKQCDSAGKNCQSLPGKRLYSGASWTQTLPLSTAVEYQVRSATASSTEIF